MDRFDFGPPPQPAAPVRHVYTVAELTGAIRLLVETSLFDIWVEGEISNCKPANSGHLYFTLKDDRAQVSVVLFKTARRLLRFRPEDGLHVLARGRVTVYEARGALQMVAEHLEPKGVGALQLAFEQLKAKLRAEGLFDAARKRPLPPFPRKIGIVTSLEGAAIRDIHNVLTRRHPNVHLVIRASRVQGEGAAVEVARAVAALTRVPGVEVLIVARGGGSIEDLWTFNDETVARAIAASSIPVISAVGHETDFTIADFVADVRAPTPSAAAELVIARTDEFGARVEALHDRLAAGLRHRLHVARARVMLVTGRPGFSGFRARVALRGRRVVELEAALGTAWGSRMAKLQRRRADLAVRLERLDLRRRLAAVRAQLARAADRLAGSIHRRVERSGARLGRSVASLESLSPLSVLARGYSLCWDATGTRLIRDAATVAPGEEVRLRLARGELDCAVSRVRSGEEQ